MIKISLLTIVLLVLNGSFAFAQSSGTPQYDPTVLILKPHSFTWEKGLRKTVAELEKEVIANRKSIIRSLKRQTVESDGTPENIQTILEKQIEFTREMDHAGLIASFMEQFLLYRIFERFENLLVYAVQETSAGDVGDLGAMAEMHGMQFVVNFPRVNSYRVDGEMRSDITVQFYDHRQGMVVFEKEFTGDARNRGFEAACEDGSLSCTYSNAIAQAVPEVLQAIALNSPTLIREREVAAARMQVLMTSVYPQPPAREIADLIAQQDSSISTAGFYHGLMHESGEKFIAFFLQDSKAQNHKELDNSPDRVINIESNDLSNLDNIPALYAFIVVGVRDAGRWFLEKKNATYFSAADLETGRQNFFSKLSSWHFFKEGTADIDPAFWETYFFARLQTPEDYLQATILEAEAMLATTEDKRKQAQLQKMIEDCRAADPQERNYRELMDDFYRTNGSDTAHYGKYKIVAKALQREADEEEAQFKENLGNEVLIPFLKDLLEAPDTEILAYKKHYKRFLLIYPRDKRVILFPILFEYAEERKEMLYYVLIPNGEREYDIFRWTYFQPVEPIQGWLYGPVVVEQLEPLCRWNFSYEYLDDEDFWDKYVLKREAGEYKYLQPANGN